eukprot:gene3574-6309_t
MNQTKQEYKEIEEKFSQAVSQHKQYVSEFKNQTMKYSELETLLSKLIHKISHPCMVPLGELACIPGELYHTNEVMVYLGGEYHAKVSTKTAIEIIQGRKKNLKKNIEFEESELNKLYTRMGLTKEIFQPKVENPKEEEEPFEIVEFEKYENVKKPKSILKKNIKVTEKDEDDIEKMLKQLELEEEIWDEEIMEEEITIENNNTTEITDEDEFNKYFKKSKKVQFGDEIIQEEEEEENFERNEELLDKEKLNIKKITKK